jgi:hypothetical protein
MPAPQADLRGGLAHDLRDDPLANRAELDRFCRLDNVRISRMDFLIAAGPR